LRQFNHRQQAQVVEFQHLPTFWLIFVGSRPRFRWSCGSDVIDNEHHGGTGFEAEMYLGAVCPGKPKDTHKGRSIVPEAFLAVFQIKRSLV
jgi:hypothetical protein